MSAPFTINNVATADSYTNAATVKGGPAFVRFFVQVYTAAVNYEIQQLDGSWAPETFLGPAIGPINRLGQGIRFRSAAAGVPASVSVDCLTLEEVVGGGDALSTPTVNIGPGGVVTPVSTGAGMIVGQIIEMAGGNPDPTRCLACDGGSHLKSDFGAGAAGTLDGYLAAAGYPYGSDALHFNTPDKRERVSIGAGPNTSLGGTEGVAVANRHATRHRHSPHTHGGGNYLHSGGIASVSPGTVYDADAIPPADGGSGIATDPLDGPAFIATNFYIVYAT